MRTSNNKYPQGYAPKIEYWTNQLANATDITAKFNALAKLQYFTARQQEWNDERAQLKSLAESVEARKANETTVLRWEMWGETEEIIILRKNE